MIAEDIRRLLREEPFEPFEIHLVNGRSLRVPHRDFVWIPPKHVRTVYVIDEDGYVELVNTILIVSISPLRGPDNSNGDSSWPASGGPGSQDDNGDRNGTG